MASVNARRAYSSPQRDRAALATRQAVLDAAHRLFVSRGYVATTIDDIAAAAEVSRPTVFAVGSKAELFKLVRDVAIAGDDQPVAVPDRAAMDELRDAPDAEETLRVHARNVVRINARYAPIDEVLRQAAGVDRALADLWSTSEQERHAGAGIVVDEVLRKGALKPGLDRQRAVDILWLLMASDQLARMRRRDWTDAAFEQWLGDTFVAQLLA